MSNVDIGRYSKRFVQLFWDPAPKNDDGLSDPIWCLGRSYNAGAAVTTHRLPSSSDERPNGPASSNSSFENVVTPQVAADRDPMAPTSDGEDWPEAFLDDFEARLWFTYRSNFPPIAKSQDPKAASAMSLSVRLKSQISSSGGFTSDAGWGCMIRSGQSLLANSLMILRLGRDWNRKLPRPEEREILSLFADDSRAPFSIHRFVEYGAESCGTYPGQWFGPSATAKCIEGLSNNFKGHTLRVYVTGDGPDVYEDVLLRIAKPDGETFQPTLLLVGTRLGIDRITPVYRNALQALLQLPQAVGIAGGRPSSSHYFIGTQGSNFFYLDPHHTRPALSYHENAADFTDEEVDSYHSRRLRRISVEEMDPSMLIAFFFREEADWQAWRHSVSQAPGKAIFHVVDHEAARYGQGAERDEAVDEVETLDTDFDDGNEAE